MKRKSEYLRILNQEKKNDEFLNKKYDRLKKNKKVEEDFKTKKENNGAN